MWSFPFPSSIPKVCGRALMHNVHKMHNDLEAVLITNACLTVRCVKYGTVGVFLNYACIAALALLPAFTQIAAGQEDAEDSPYRSGLIATYSVGDQSATRSDEVVAFDWQDAACDPRLLPGAFTAEWRGRLWARGAGSYTIACYAQGDVTVKLAGKTVLSGRAEQPQWISSQPLELEFDYHPLEISFRR